MFRCCLLICVTVATLGCDGKYPVRGKVQFSDGSPLAGGMVIFTDEKGETGGYGPLQPDGSFEITYDDPRDGLPKGTYGVSVRPPSPWSMTEEERRTAPPRGGVALKYLQPETSEIKVVIDKQMTNLVIKLDKDTPAMRPGGGR